MIGVGVKLIGDKPYFFAICGEWRSDRSYTEPDGHLKALKEAFAYQEDVRHAAFVEERDYWTAVDELIERSWIKYQREIEAFRDAVLWEEVASVVTLTLVSHGRPSPG